MDTIFKYSKVIGFVCGFFGVITFLGGLSQLTMDFGSGLFNLLIGAALVWVGLWLFRYNDRLNARNKAEQLRHQRYIESLAPKNMAAYIAVNIAPDDVTNYLSESNRTVKYMFIDNARRVTFPESSFGNNRGYYITEVQFEYRTDKSISGTNESHGFTAGRMNIRGGSESSGHMDRYGNISGGGIFGGSGNFIGGTSSRGSFSGHINEREIPHDAYITLVNDDKSQSFKLNLLEEYEDHVNIIKQYFLLSDFEQKQFGIK